MKLKNLVLSLGTVGTVAAPLATVIACGDWKNKEEEINKALEVFQKQKEQMEKYKEQAPVLPDLSLYAKSKDVEEYVKKIDIPQGEKGDKGDRGDQGLQGPKGDTGDKIPQIHTSKFIELSSFIRDNPKQIINVFFETQNATYQVLGIPNFLYSDIAIDGIFFIPRSVKTQEFKSVEMSNFVKNIGRLIISSNNEITFEASSPTKTETIHQTRLIQVQHRLEKGQTQIGIKLHGWKPVKFINVLAEVNDRYPAIYQKAAPTEWGYSTKARGFTNDWKATLNAENETLTIKNKDDNLFVGGQFWIEYTKEIKVVEWNKKFSK